MDNEILDIFYKEIIQEAAVGRVDCGVMYNILFSTNLEDEKLIESKPIIENLLIPRLRISNKENFNKLLLKYLSLALDFYKNCPFLKFVSEGGVLRDEIKYVKEKTLMTTLWSNATFEDFNDPCKFLCNRIAYLEDRVLGNLIDSKIELGFSEKLNGNLYLEVSKSDFNNETPYFVDIVLVSDNNEIYRFPKVYLGINDKEACIYAIQGRKMIKEHISPYEKKVDRLLRKIDSGFDVKDDNYENQGIVNLKDVSPSFLVAANIVLGFLSKFYIDRIKIPSILIQRYNGKKISNHVHFLIDEDENAYFERNEKIKDIQSNLTEKHLRTFRRLSLHNSGIDIIYYPMEKDSNMYFEIESNNVVFNNELLEETYFLANRYSNNNITKK